MDFEIVLKIILKEFQRQNVRYGLIGGFALGALGVHRATIDLDFLVNMDDMPKADAIMRARGYQCAYKSENVSQYVSPAKVFGEVDFLHAFREISVGMLERAKELDIFDGKLKIKVLAPEDIIGLKLQASVNNPDRAAREYSDMEALMERYGNKLDWWRLEEYFSLFERAEKFAELRTRYNKEQGGGMRMGKG
ncbi:MAG: hypothetical protein FD189_453 [Elusimicrobia bacterium]|nr:MAG: hypothetical protein FD154_512 [Elusimicrobiota bacterium]KAF0157678.1 MAG: hypothetical protein FD189_453 [Elusimicrobiota bacterium]